MISDNTGCSNNLFDQISLNKFKIDADIGKGSYATVRLGIDK